MGTPASPGVYINEIDLSEYAAEAGGNVTAILGAATKGPLNTPTVIRNEAELRIVFGGPLESDYGIRAAIQILKGGGQVIFVRVGHSPITATLSLNKSTGGVTGVPAAGSIALGGQVADGNSVVISDGVTPVTFEFDDGGGVTGGAIAVTIGATAALSAAALAAAINAHAFGVTATYTVGETDMTLANDAAGAAGNVAITKTGANITVVGMAGGVTAVGATLTPVLKLDASSPGTWGNALAVQIGSTLFATPETDGFDLTILDVVDNSGTVAAVETFKNVSLDDTSARNVVKAINEGITDVGPKSGYVVATKLASGLPVSGKFNFSAGTVGTDGITGLVDADYVGTMNGLTATGLKSLRNPDRYDFSTLVVPGVSKDAVIQEMIALCEKRGDAVCLIDPPRGLTRDQVIDWHNGTSGLAGAPSAPINNSYAAIFYWWLQVNDATLNKRLWLPPSAFAASLFARVDGTESKYLPVAGDLRGVISGGEVEYSPEQDDRDLLEGNGNKINPFVNFIGQGPTIWGNNTTQRKPTGLDSLHVRRALNAAKKIVRVATRVFPFSPNDTNTWDAFKLRVNPLLQRIKDGQGFANFSVQIDSVLNPADIKAQKRMRSRIVVEYVPIGEKVEIDFVLVGPGNTLFNGG